MKKIYITPVMTTDAAEAEQMLATSTFVAGSDTQSITPSDDDYDDEFSVKEFSTDW